MVIPPVDVIVISSPPLENISIIILLVVEIALSSPPSLHLTKRNFLHLPPSRIENKSLIEI